MNIYSDTRGVHVHPVHPGWIRPLKFKAGKGVPSKTLDRNLSPHAISEHCCILIILIGETLKFFITYICENVTKLTFFVDIRS